MHVAQRRSVVPASLAGALVSASSTQTHLKGSLAILRQPSAHAALGPNVGSLKPETLQLGTVMGDQMGGAGTLLSGRNL
jgi:hypothetical protein